MHVLHAAPGNIDDTVGAYKPEDFRSSAEDMYWSSACFHQKPANQSITGDLKVRILAELLEVGPYRQLCVPSFRIKIMLRPS